MVFFSSETASAENAGARLRCLISSRLFLGVLPYELKVLFAVMLKEYSHSEAQAVEKKSVGCFESLSTNGDGVMGNYKYFSRSS